MAIWNLFQKNKGNSASNADEKATAETKETKVQKKSEPAVAKKAAEPKAQPTAKAQTASKPAVAKTQPATKSASPAKAPAAKPAPAKAQTAPAAKPAAKAAPAKAQPAPASKPAAKPAAKSTSAAPKAPAAKSTPAAVKMTSEPARPAAKSAAASRPFFATTEDDVRVAFDEAIAEAEAEIAKNGSKAIGKYEFNLEVDGYHFYLIANNGQVLFDSPSFTTLLGALNGIKTFKKTVATEEFDIKMDKYKRYRFILANKYYGENYTTKDQCQKCAESVRNFAGNSRINRYKPDKEALAVYEAARMVKKSPEEVDWNAIARAEAAATKKGKFEICRENDEYCFYLLASNGQILYSSRYYANESACRKGVESFKRAAYVGNFFVDQDKFGNYRYVLKNIGSAPSFIGESYDNKPQCEKIIESVKNFIVTASVETEATEGAE